MKLLQLLAIGEIDARVLEDLGPKLSTQFRVPWDILPGALDPQQAFHAERQQYHSTEILERVHAMAREECWRIVGVTGYDLYIPILTFVFGEAQMNGRAAVVSMHRLRQEFYGLPADADLLHARLLKEVMHELGHTLDLRHCDDYRCAMASSHAVEWIDLKDASLCASCVAKVDWPQTKKMRFGLF